MRASTNMHTAQLLIAALVISCGTSVSLAQTTEPSKKEPAAKTPAPAGSDSTSKNKPASKPEAGQPTAKPSLPATKPSQPAAKPAPATTPAAAPAKATSDSKPAVSNPALGTQTTIVVEVIEGNVGVRQSADQKMVVLKVGDTLEEGAELVVSVQSLIRVRVGLNQVLTFDQPGKAIFRRAFNDGEKDVTRVKLEVGRVTFNVDSSKVKNDVKIEAPDVTLAIKGTIGGIQVAEGFPTRAYGDLENKGRIELDYRDGRTIAMTRNEESDSATPDPAKKHNELATSDTPKGGSRDKDEKRLLKRAISASQDVELSIGNTKTPINGIDLMPILIIPNPDTVHPTPGNIQHLDTTGGLFQTTPDLSSSFVRRGVSIDPTATTGGSAILRNLPNDSGRFIQLEMSFPTLSNVRNRFLQISYDDSAPSIILGQFVGHATAVPTLSGLGALGSTLYASGSLNNRGGIYEVDFTRGELTQVMDLGASLEGGLGGSTKDGTLFAVARDPGSVSTDGLLSRSVIVEFDPRNKYLVSAYAGFTGLLGANGATANPGNIDLASLQSISGVAPTENGIVISAVSSTAGGRTVFLRYDTGAGDVRATPTLAEVRATPESFTHGLASEAPGVVRASVMLAPPTGRIDRTGISATFAEMAYSTQAFNSGFVERAVKREILANAIDPAGCGASGALGSLRNILAAHIDQRAGVGESVAHFHDMLPAMHPCTSMH